MNLELCGKSFTAFLPSTNIPVEVSCKYEKGHKCSHLAEGTIDGMKFKAQWHLNRKDSSPAVKAVMVR